MCPLFLCSFIKNKVTIKESRYFIIYFIFFQVTNKPQSKFKSYCRFEISIKFCIPSYLIYICMNIIYNLTSIQSAKYPFYRKINCLSQVFSGLSITFLDFFGSKFFWFSVLFSIFGSEFFRSEFIRSQNITTSHEIFFPKSVWILKMQALKV